MRAGRPETEIPAYEYMKVCSMCGVGYGEPECFSRVLNKKSEEAKILSPVENEIVKAIGVEIKKAKGTRLPVLVGRSWVRPKWR